MSSGLAIFHLKTTVYLSVAVTDIRFLYAGTVACSGLGVKAAAQSEQTVIVIRYIISSKLPAIYRRYVLPVDPFAQMNNKSAWVRKLPAFRQVALPILVRTEEYLIIEY